MLIGRCRALATPWSAWCLGPRVTGLLYLSKRVGRRGPEKPRRPTFPKRRAPCSKKVAFDARDTAFQWAAINSRSKRSASATASSEQDEAAGLPAHSKIICTEGPSHDIGVALLRENQPEAYSAAECPSI